MKKIEEAVTVIVLLAASGWFGWVGCDWFNRVDPPISTASEKGYPCGKDGLICVEMGDAGTLYKTGMCCDQGEVCGGVTYVNQGCPPNECCDELIGANRQDPAHPKGLHKQWKAGTPRPVGLP